MEEEILERVKEVARKIVERVKKATADTETDLKIDPETPTEEVPAPE